MTALRQEVLDENYEMNSQYLEALPSPVIKHRLRPEIQKKASPFKLLLDRLLVFVITLSLVAVLVAGCTYILKRYVEVHKTQVAIFNLKQDIKQLDKTADELLVQKESALTLEELEMHAVKNLGMVKASEGYKVVVTQAYRVTQQDLVQPALLVAEEEKVPVDDPLVAFGAWIKRFASF